jgi:hypothetical protein
MLSYTNSSSKDSRDSQEQLKNLHFVSPQILNKIMYVCMYVCMYVYMYDVTLRRVGATIFAVEKQYYIF